MPALTRFRGISALAVLLLLSGCATMPGWISADGPSRQQVQENLHNGQIDGVQLLMVDDTLARRLAQAKQLDNFAQIFGNQQNKQYLIGPGDIIEVSVWEAPPAMLFGGMVLDPAVGPSTTQVVNFPQQMVTAQGTITMPFAGYVPVKGRTTQQIEHEIVKRLTGKAHQPQVLVRVVKNNTANVTVVGDVKQSTRMPLTPTGERLLDALAAGGGASQPVNKVAIQLTRGKTTATMALDTVIRQPQQNIPLNPGDVVTALFQPQSFSVLGATGKNDEIPFEAQGISLAQALARSGGLDDRRADARGVFIFRFEDSRLLPADAADHRAGAASSASTSVATAQAIPASHPASADQDAKQAVVYVVDLRDPGSLFAMQHFPMQDHDVIYVSNSPAAEVDKFLRMVGSVLSPAINVQRTFN
ncbi:polysaccharide biosynthesis/export family protein [Castellaniella sp.]|uniref:polysaccharide biosynthesis/export family protein n=1 Tax=Castellaniella sp. TaxID=1955812 RepID=UPI002AFE2013|nr:polysaccharide biosynthesis/export family protein [Castellaniella sp.]